MTHHADSSGRAAALPVTALVPVHPRQDGWTPERQREFIERLADTGCVRAAAAAVGMTEQSAHRLRRRSDARAFAEAWEAAVALGRQRLIETAWDRAVNGTLKTHIYHGEVVAETRVYSDRLLIYLLERCRPGPRTEQAADGRIARVLGDWDAAIDRIAAPPPPPDPDPDEDPHMIWQDEDGEWVTDYPPPPDFDGEQYGRYGEDDYHRTLAPEEAAVLAADDAEELARFEAQRRRAFGLDGA